MPIDPKDLTELTESSSVVLPVTDDQLASFVKSLLGKSQTISKTIPGAFEADLEDIINLDHLIHQRIHQQNKASLIEFTAKIVFDDRSAVELKSLDELKAYHEVKPVISEQLHLTWGFLVQFEDKKVPEKQEIEFVFLAKTGMRFLVPDSNFISLLSFDSSSGGMIFFMIHHTARTWGVDLESLLTQYSENKIIDESKVRKTVRKHSGKIGLATAGLFFGLSASSMILASGEHAALLANVANDFFASGPSTIEALQYLTQQSVSGSWYKFFFFGSIFLVIAFILSIILAIVIDAAGETRRPSFILLTKKSKTNKQKQTKKYQSSWIRFVLAILTGMIAGIAANFIYPYLI